MRNPINRAMQLLAVALILLTTACTKESDPAPSLTPTEQVAAQLTQGTWQITGYVLNGREQALTNQDRAARFSYRLGANQKSSGRLTWTTAQDVIEADWRLTDPTTLVISGGGDQLILTEVKITENLVLSYVQLVGNNRNFFTLRRVR